MEPWEELDFVHTPRSIIAEMVISLGAEHDGDILVSGSAVIVNRYLAVTASHVIDDYFERIEGRAPTHGHHASFAVTAIQTLKEGAEAAVWTIDKIWMASWTDIAFIRLHPVSDTAATYEWRGRLRMNALPPPIGTRVAAFGYHSGSVSVDEAGEIVRWTDRPTSTYGLVSRVFEQSRDSIRLPFPCFEIDARVDGGMSGGPVFNPSGELCGILCSTFPASGGDDRHTSYAATLWPALATPIDMDVEGLPASKTRAALDLAAHGALLVKNWDRVQLTSTADRNGSHVSLAPTAVSQTLTRPGRNIQRQDYRYPDS